MVKKDKRKRPDRRSPSQHTRQGARREGEATFFCDGWQKAYRLLSVQISALLGVFASAYAFIPEFKEVLHPTVFGILMALGALGVIFGRVKRQNRKP